MTDTYKDVDLTTLVEKVASARYERDRNVIIDRSGGRQMPPTWEDLPAFDKQGIKVAVLPIVTDVITALNDMGAL